MTNAELDSAILSTAARPRMPKFYSTWELARVVRESGTDLVRAYNHAKDLTLGEDSTDRLYGYGPDPADGVVKVLSHTYRWGWRPK